MSEPAEVAEVKQAVEQRIPSARYDRYIETVTGGYAVSFADITTANTTAVDHDLQAACLEVESIVQLPLTGDSQVTGRLIVRVKRKNAATLKYRMKNTRLWVKVIVALIVLALTYQFILTRFKPVSSSLTNESTHTASVVGLEDDVYPPVDVDTGIKPPTKA